MSTRHALTLSLSFDSPREAAIIAEALAPEAGEDLPRAVARVEQEQGTVHVHVQAADIVSLRAGANSYLRWARTAHEATEAANVKDE